MLLALSWMIRLDKAHSPTHQAVLYSAASVLDAIAQPLGIALAGLV